MYTGYVSFALACFSLPNLSQKCCFLQFTDKVESFLDLLGLCFNQLTKMASKRHLSNLRVILQLLIVHVHHCFMGTRQTC